MYLYFIYMLSMRIYVFTAASGACYASNPPDHAAPHACKVPHSRRVLHTYSHSHHASLRSVAASPQRSKLRLLAQLLDHSYLQFLHLLCVCPLHRRLFFKSAECFIALIVKKASSRMQIHDQWPSLRHLGTRVWRLVRWINLAVVLH